MHEIIVRLSRTIANDDRLRILSYLIASGETIPTKLAADLKIAPNALSVHLAKLVTAGLLTRRRSGTWSYCLAASPYGPGTLSGELSAWLHSVLAAPNRRLQHGGLHEVRHAISEAAPRADRQLVFQAATAFTDVRRVELMLRLADGKPLAAEAICRELHMSTRALERHTAKLSRRGYLAAQTTEAREWYQIAKTFPAAIHEGLWKIIQRTFRKGSRQTS